jgi:hypothetical protein
MEWAGRVRSGFIWLRTGSEAGYYEHGNELMCPIKCGKFLDGLSGACNY